MKIKKIFALITLTIFILLALPTIYYYTIPIEKKIDDKICEGCNVILVTFDALRTDRLGIYGYEKDTSPNIDALSRKSYVFTDSMSQSGSTMYSFPSLFTSKLPYTDDILGRGGNIAYLKNDADITISEVLKEHGYSTYAVTTVKFATRDQRINNGFDVFDEDYTSYEKGDNTRRRAMNKIENNDGNHFFLWMHFRQPHDPFDPSMELFQEFYDNPDNEPTMYNITGPSKIASNWGKKIYEEVLDYYVNVKGEKPVETVFFNTRLNMTKTMIKQVNALYDASIREVDKEFGLFLEYLESKGLDKNTVIIISADHGESLGEHSHIGHNKLHQQVIHTPLIVHLPDNKHKTLDYPVMNIDIFPTILEVLGLKIPKNMSRRGRIWIRGITLFNESREEYIQISEYSTKRILKKGGYKLWRDKDGKIRLYKLTEDPLERKDLSENYTRIVDMILEQFNDNRPDIIAQEDEDFDMLQMLRDIGYAY